MQRICLLLCLLLCCALLQACGGQSATVAEVPASQAEASGEYDEYDEFAELYGEDSFVPIADPFEGWNRFWFAFNDVSIRYVIKPLYKSWEFITPQEVRSGIGNFFHNLAMPVRFLNNIFQGKFNEAGVEFSAFIINTVVGLGGTIDVASRHEEVQALTDEDFGQTLGAWGTGEGAYFVWPLLGPSNLRDTGGLIADFFMDPTLYMGLEPYNAIGSATGQFNSLGDSISSYETITDSAIEPYSAVRDAYTQHRRSLIEK